MAKAEAPKQKVKRPTAEKRLIQNEKKRQQARVFKSQIRTAVRHFEDSLKTSDAAKIEETLRKVHSMADLAAKRGIYKQNKAQRIKSRSALRVAKQAAA